MKKLQFLTVLFVLGLLITSSRPGFADNHVEKDHKEPNVRVLLIRSLAEVEFIPSGETKAAIKDSEESLQLAGGSEMLLSVSEGKVSLSAKDSEESALSGTSITLTPGNGMDPILIKQVPFGVGWWWESAEDRSYEGELEVVAGEDNNLNIILELPVEEYLRGVVPSEIGPDAPTEALKAQAVAARSETMTALLERTYEGPGYDICADVDCQVFSGLVKRNDATDQAIKDTRGLILSWEGKPIHAYYASNCGGHSEDIGDVWPDRDRGIPCWSGNLEGPNEDPGDLTKEDVVEAWIKSKPDSYCNTVQFPSLPEWTRKYFRWEHEVNIMEMSRLAAEVQHVGRVLDIVPVERGVSGRLKKVKIVGSGGEFEVGPELAIRRLWEPPLRSSCFIVEKLGTDPEEPEGFRILGAGYGHGVGMCQTGAMGRALSGQDFKEILSHYYTKAEVISAYE